MNRVQNDNRIKSALADRGLNPASVAIVGPETIEIPDEDADKALADLKKLRQKHEAPTETKQQRVINYNVTDAAIEALRQEYSGMEITDVKSYRAVVSAISVVRSKRVAVEKTRKDLKADALAWGRAVDTEAKRIKGLLDPIEEELKATKQTEDDRKAAIKAEKERIERKRVEGIRDRISDIQRMCAGLAGLSATQLNKLGAEVEALRINPDEYEEFTQEAKLAMHDTWEAIGRALEIRKRLDREEAERKAEAKRLEKIRKEQEAEAARLKAEREEQEAERRKIEEEKAVIEAAKRAEQEAEKKRAEVENARFARMAATKSLQQSSPMEVGEEAEDAERKRQEALRTDKEKLIAWIETVRSVPGPELNSDAAHELIRITYEAIDDILCDMLEAVEVL